jgi:hypothetical protein
MTKEEKNALEKVESSLTHNGSRYSVAVPWKEDCLILPINREMAIERLEGTEVDSIRNVVSEMSSPWYLPHFPIVKLNKTTTKARIVFDFSAKYERVLMNDAIYAGPN